MSTSPTHLQSLHDVQSDNEDMASRISSTSVQSIFEALDNVNVPSLSQRSRDRGRPRGRGRGYKTAGRARGGKTSTISANANKFNELEKMIKSVMDSVTTLNKTVNEIHTAVHDVRENISQLQHENNLFKQDLNEVHEKISQLQQENNSVKQDLNVKHENICQLQRETNFLKQDFKLSNEKNKALEIRINKLEQRERRDQIVISSPVINSISDTSFQTEMVKLTATTLKLRPETTDTLKKFSFRKIGQEDGKKSALVTIPNQNVKAELFKAARKIRPTNFFVNEALIKERQRLFYEARRIKKETKSNFSVFTFRGDIFIKKTKDSDPVEINFDADILAMV